MAVRTTSKEAPALPAVIDLGRRIAALSFEYRRQDQISLDTQDNRSAHVAAQHAMEVIDQQSQTLRELVTTIPARSLADAAVQIAEAFNVAEKLESTVRSAEEVEYLGGLLTRLLLSVLPLVAAAADLDPVAMGWESEVGSLYAVRFAGLEGVA